MSARTTRIRLFAASTVALAALALTACEDGVELGSAAATSAPTATHQGTADSNADSADEATTDDTTTDTTTGTTTGKDTSTGKGTSTGKDTSTRSDTSAGSDTTARTGTGAASAKPGKCSAAEVRITATEVSRPLNHLLLTATNTGSKTCYLPAYPAARFGEAQAVPPVVADSQPQAVTTLAPGESGYAGVLTSAADGSGTNGYTAKTLTVPFDNGSIATVTLPADGVHVDDSLKVTYWLTSMGEALSH